MNAEANEGLTTFEFRFKIDAPKFAAHYGIQLPDDSSDEGLSEGESGDGVAAEAKDSDCGYRGEVEAVAEDADVFFPKHVKATLDECRAKNPMFCPYHGMKAVAGEIEGILRAAGVNGKVECTVYDHTGNTLNVGASVRAPKSDEAKVQAAMANFFNLPGITKQDDMESAGGEIEGNFDLDMLDPQAKARWGFGQQPPVQQQTQTPTPAPVPAQPPAQPASQPVSQQQPAPAAKPKRTRTRKQAAKSAAPVAPVEAPQELAQEPSVEAPVVQPEKVVAVELPSDGEPELYPGVAPKEPPKWTPPYDANELVQLSKMAERIGKTAVRIDDLLDQGKMDGYLQNKKGDPAKPNAHLPKGLQKYKNEVDFNALKTLADKDTDGQVKKMLEAAEKINASEGNGWKDKIGLTAADVDFDPTKYADPYKKERAAFESYKPGSEGRKAALDSAELVEKSKSKDAPKDAAKKCRDAAGEMDQLEQGYEWAKSKGIKGGFLKKIGQAYYKANKEFEDASKKCKEWLGKQSVMQATIEDTAAVFREKNGRDALYLTKSADVLKEKEKVAKDICAQNFPNTFGKDPEKCAKMYEKNVKWMLDNASVRISMPFAAVETLLADPNAATVNRGYENGKYQSTRVDYDYARLAERHFSVTPTTFRDVHKYGAVFENTGKHSGSSRSRRYGDVEVSFDLKKCLAFISGCHSYTRGCTTHGWNASLCSAPKITNVPYLLQHGGFPKEIEKLFTTDMSKESDGFKKVWKAMSVGSSHYGNDMRVPEIWFADDVTRDMVKGIYTQSPAAQKKIAAFGGTFIQKNGIELN